MANKEIHFVYNANSGKSAAFVDSMHKVFSPGTYQCDLCKLTYGLVSMRPEWKEYIASIEKEGYTLSFFHKNEIKTEFDLPCIVLDGELLVGKDEFNQVKDVNALIALLKLKLSENK